MSLRKNFLIALGATIVIVGALAFVRASWPHDSVCKVGFPTLLSCTTTW
jgi:hypothetical protein